MLATVFSHPKPVVAAINGHAIAGGCVLACAADRRLMGREAGRIGVTELLVGRAISRGRHGDHAGATAPQYFEDTIFSGATFMPPDALARGLVARDRRAGAAARPRDCCRAYACGAPAAGLRAVQAADPPAGAGTAGPRGTRRWTPPSRRFGRRPRRSSEFATTWRARSRSPDLHSVFRRKWRPVRRGKRVKRKYAQRISPISRI